MAENRFYLRGLTPLGLLNTFLAVFTNRVIVRHLDKVTKKTLYWSIGKATDFRKVKDNGTS